LAAGKERRAILLAEDHKETIDTASRYLEANGYRMVVARTGTEAIQRAKEERPDIIVVSAQLTGTDGLQLIRRLRSDADALPPASEKGVPGPGTTCIVATTSLSLPGDREQCLALGADEVLKKPVSPQHLVDVICRARGPK
jgi:CheY-like chemotaxis protein